LPISNELFVFDLQAHADSGRMVGQQEVIQIGICGTVTTSRHLVRKSST